jgi:hypothetical protein
MHYHLLFLKGGFLFIAGSEFYYKKSHLVFGNSGNKKCRPFGYLKAVCFRLVIVNHMLYPGIACGFYSLVKLKFI